MQFDRRRHYFNMSSERSVVTIRSMPCRPKTLDAVAALIGVMQNLIADPRLMASGEMLFDSSRLVHDGTTWVWTFESMEPRKDLNL